MPARAGDKICENRAPRFALRGTLGAMSEGDDATLPDTRAVNTDPVSRVSVTDLGERYEVGPLLGRGGMGEVRLARDLRIDREVAVKLMHSQDRDEVTLGRFFREARVQGVLEHPAVVPVHDMGIDREGNPYFVMKRLAGTTLHDVITTKDPVLRDRWPRRTLLARFVDVCLAIEFAHQRGVIHRDIKPANIMLGDFGEAYVLDWGLARIATDGESFRDVGPLSGDGEGGQTVAGELLGTPGYMSPEQAKGDPIDTRTDVYALGAVLYEILAGFPALPRGMTGIAATIAAPYLKPSERIGDIPPELDALCVRATRAERDQRPSARELADSLQNFLDGDRDVAARRELAEVHVERARAAMAGAGDEARSTAMREAGRALGLDQANTGAAEILSRLLLERPDKIPAEALASADLERGETRRMVTRTAAFGFFGMIPALATVALFDVRHIWPVVVTAVMCVFTALFAYYLGRAPRPMKTPLLLVMLALNMALITLAGLILSTLFILPIFVVASLAGWLWQPTTYRPWIVIVAHALPLVVLLALEQLGTLPPSIQVEAGAVILRSYSIDFTSSSALLMFVVSMIANVGHLTTVTMSGRRAAESAQDQQHAQAWHLRQLLPRDSAITGPVEKT